MKNLKLLFFFCFIMVSIKSLAQIETNDDFFFKFKANKITYKTIITKSNDVNSVNLFIKSLKDSTFTVRGFQREDTILINNGASFHFHFFKASKPRSDKEINVSITKKFSLDPKEYHIADYDMGGDISFEKRTNYYDGLAEYDIPRYKLFSFQYPWVNNRRQAKFNITKVDMVAKTISGNFSFTVTYAELVGSPTTKEKETFKKVIEVDITEGEFFLPFKVLTL